MAPIVNSIVVDDVSVDRQNSFQITATCTDCDIVYAVINGMVLQLEAGAGTKYRSRIHAVQVGQYTGDFKVYALKTATGELANAAYGATLTIAAVDPVTPADFMVALYATNGTYKWRDGFTIIPIYDEKRIDRQNEIGILIAEGQAQRRNVARKHYKNVKYPLTIQVLHNSSFMECRRMFEQHVLNVEEKFVILDSDAYDEIEILDDGKRVPSWGTHSIVHKINLVKYLQKVNIDGY